MIFNVLAPSSCKNRQYERCYFDKTRWPLNKRLPRGKLGKDLAAIAQKHRLEKPQIARQLKNCKDKKYRLKDVVLEMTPEQIKKVIEDR